MHLYLDIHMYRSIDGKIWQNVGITTRERERDAFRTRETASDSLAIQATIHEQLLQEELNDLFDFEPDGFDIGPDDEMFQQCIAGFDSPD